ncbi:alpha/beta fold hydrolase [Acidibrevibacterium fodinaquatile]|uniref:alpha/beta fold hydrolase n=1 Tax=Acidibrevibacterium fodinaquatile TaxID=1969806 RepID=UPI001F086D5C|nr:alpha/beta fold hydrolase [Acidibrevibacterium fodinaquatile]
MLKSSASIAGLPLSNGAWPGWNPRRNPDLARLAHASGDPDAFARTVFAATLAEDRALIAGIAAYRRHPWRRTLPDPPAIWSEGETRLLDYGGEGPPLLFIPSLINRGHILDLDEGASLVRFLAAAGFHPLLLDWGWPGERERRFTLTDYIAGRLDRALGAVAEKPILVGYCMGGLLALAAALREPRRLRALALLATPWDFHADNPARAAALARLLPLMEPAFALGHALPIDWLQTLFALVDPYGVGRKYRAFATLDPDSTRARRFVALEDWLNDGVPLAAPVAREALGGWYGDNTPARGNWLVAGLPVDPATLRLPTLVAAPTRDRLVPPASARPLATLIPDATLITPQVGHIGMIAGTNAETALWRPMLTWLHGV